MRAVKLSKDRKMPNRELHYKYILSYLCIAIILLLALDYYDTPNLVDKLSFALTLSSLLLAVLAIFYTIISANKQDNQFIRLIETNSELKNSAIEINSVSKEISGMLTKVPKHFENLEAKLDSLSETEKLKSDIIPTTEENSKDIVINRNMLMHMISRLQFSAMGVIFLYSQASKNNKSIDFSLFEQLDLISPKYGIGVLTGFGSVGLIDFKIHQQNIVPIKCDQLLFDELEKMLDAIAGAVDEGNSARIKETINNIKEIYAYRDRDGHR